MMNGMVKTVVLHRTDHAVLLDIQGVQRWLPRPDVQQYECVGNEIWLPETALSGTAQIALRHRPYDLAGVVRSHTTTGGIVITPKPNQPQQQAAFEKLHKLKRFALFMQMRAGKTKVAIDLICNHFTNGVVDKVLWLCPNSAVQTAEEQWQKFAVRDVPRKIVALETVSGCGVKRLNNILEWFDERCAIVIDESQMVKNRKAKRSQRLDKVLSQAPVVGILSGTPITQNVQDLYNQARALDWRIFSYRTYHQFLQNHLVMSERILGLICDVKNTEYLSERLQPFVFEWFVDYPNRKRYKTIEIEMSQTQKHWYQKIKDEMMLRLMNCTERKSDVYLMFTALQSVLSGYVSARVMKSVFGEQAGSLYLPTPKLDRLLDYVQNLDEQKIIWCTRRYELHSIAARLPESIVISGEMSADVRHERVQQFRQSRNGTLIAMVQVAKRAIEMSECNEVIYYGHSFDFESREQSQWRTLLPTKTAICHYTDLVYEKSLDERILQAHDKKYNVIKAFLDLLKQDRQQAIKDMEQL